MSGFELPILEIGSIQIAPSIAMLAGGLLCGQWATRWRAGAVGLDAQLANVLFAWMVCFAFTGAIFWRVVADPMAERTTGWVLQGLASLPAMIGGCLGAVLFLWMARANARERIEYLDCIAWAFPFGWQLARLGCGLTHGHPGQGGIDLSMIEAGGAAVLALLFLWLGHRRLPPGLPLGVLFIGFGSIRLLLDGLRVDRVLYAGWSLEGCAAGAAVLSGALLLWLVRGSDACGTEELA